MRPDPKPIAPSLPSRPDARAEHVTATGWRVVGKAASLVSAREQPAVLPAGRDEDVLFAASFRARPRVGGGSAVPGVLSVLSGAVARDWTDAPPLTLDRPLSRAPGRFHGLRWEPAPAAKNEDQPWRGELLWRHPHPVVAGAPCTTHVALVEHGAYTSLVVRVTADTGLPSVRGTVGAGQARPAFLSELNRSLRLVFDGEGGEPRPLGAWDIERFVRGVMFSENREHPVAVLSPLEEGGYALLPTDLADELLGLAHVYVIDRHETTFILTDTVGDKRLSCYWGALRVYMPEFSCADRPETHPLLVRERVLDPVMRAGLVGTLGRLAGRRVRMPGAIGESSPASDRPAPPAEGPAGVALAAPTTLPSVSAPTVPGGETEGDSGRTRDASTTDQPGAQGQASLPAVIASPSTADVLEPLRVLASIPGVLAGLGEQIGALADTIRGLVESNAALRDEIERLRTTNAVRAASTGALERRIGGLEIKPTRRSQRLYESDAVQLGAYLIAARATFGSQAAGFGYVRYAEQLFRVRLTEQLERRVHQIVAEIRRGRALGRMRRTHSVPGKCTRCAMRERCDEALR